MKPTESPVMAWTAKHAAGLQYRPSLDGAPLPVRILACLKSAGRPMTADELAEAADCRRDSVRDALNAAAKRGECRVEHRRGKGRQLPSLYEAL